MADLGEREEYRLSDLFAKEEFETQLELIVRIINVNFGQENEVLKNCKTLSEYAQFVAMVRENKETMAIEEAITKAMNDCIRLNILRDFLKRHKAQMKKISIYEYDAEQQRIFDKEEGREEGRVEGREEGRDEGSLIRLIVLIQKKVAKEKSISVIADELETSVEEIQPLYDAVLEYGAEAAPEKILERVYFAAEA